MPVLGPSAKLPNSIVEKTLTYFFNSLWPAMLLHFLVVIIGIFALLSHAALIAPTVLGLPADSLIQNLESQSQPPDDSFTNPSIRLHTFHQNGGPQDDLPITYRNSSHYPVVRLPYASYRPAIHNVPILSYIFIAIFLLT